MFDLSLTAEQLEFRDTVRDFVQNEVRPIAITSARLEPFEKPLLDELLDYSSRMGLRTLALSENAGGAGADTLTSCIVLEELAAGDVDIAMALAMTVGLARALEDSLSEAQKKGVLADLAEDHRYHLAFVAPEDASRGWDYHRDDAGDEPAQLTASRAGDGQWTLNGAVAFVANAPIAKLFVVQAGGATVLVPKGTAGLTVNDASSPFGGSADGGKPYARWYHGAGGEVRFDNCRVPADNVIEGAQTFDGDAFARRIDPLIAAVNLGLGRGAYDAAVDYAKIRVQGGRPIIQHQAIGTILADLTIKLELARNMIWKAAWAADNGSAATGVSELPLHTMARVYTAEAMHEATLGAAECFGAMGVMRDMPLQKYVHDALVFLNGSGHDSATKLEIAEAVAGFERSERKAA